MTDFLQCDWGPTRYLIFSTNVFDPLIYYSHLLPLIAVLILGMFVVSCDFKNHLNQKLFFVSVCFSLWTFFDLILWATEKTQYTMFFWALEILFEPLIYLGCFYLLYSFVKQKRLNSYIIITSVVLLLPIILLLPTKLSLLGYDYTNCDRAAIEGPLLSYSYILNILITLSILFFAIVQFLKQKDNQIRREIILMTLGVGFFLFTFSWGNLVQSISEDWSLGQYGLFGAPILVVFLTYLIVKFKAFDVKLIATQALVWALVILIGSQFFFIQTNINRILTGITLILAAIMGLIIVRSVKKEIAQREELAVANENQQLLIRFITHQVKGFFTKSKMVFASILEGDVGEAPAPMIELVKTGMDSDNKAVEMVQEVLKASSLRSGQMNFTFEETNMNNFIKDLAEGFKDMAVQKGLQYEVNLPTEAVSSKIDKLQLTQVIKNLIDNSVKYTLSGFVKVNLKKTGGNLLFTVHDSGVGLSDSDKAKLFKEGGRGDESLKVNVNSTGYGLFIVKKIVEGHGGKIWAESVGRGHGSTFCVELPLIK